MTEVVTRPSEGVVAAVDSVQFNETELSMLAQLGLSDAPKGDLMLFAHVCRTSGLDPFRKEIYMIGRNTQVKRYVPNTSGEGQHQETRYETVYTIQTGIQGFRKKARELADAKGETLKFAGPFWCGEDGHFREVWPEKAVPVAAKYIVYRDGESVPAVCHYDEYVQEVGSGGDRKPNSMWAKMPRNQLAKCAEAQAIQRAYPDELSGLILEDAVQDAVVIDSDGEVQEPRKRRGGKGVGGLKDRAAEAEAAMSSNAQQAGSDAREVVNAEPDTPTAEKDATPKVSAKREGLNGRMFDLLGGAGLNGDKERDNRLIIQASLAMRKQPIATSKELSDDEVKEIIATLEGFGDAETAKAALDNLLKGASAAESGTEGTLL